VKTQSKVLNSLYRTPVFLQNSPKKRPFFLSILGVNFAATVLAVAAEEFAPVFTTRVFRWKTGDLPFPAADQRGQTIVLPDSCAVMGVSDLYSILSCRGMKPRCALQARKSSAIGTKL
jgi:hypothetical protein